MMAALGVGGLPAAADARRDAGETVMAVAVDGRLAGLVAVADPLKPTSAAAIAALHRLGFRIVMATGDSERTARAVAGDVGIAMGTGADVAIESAGVTLVKGDLGGIVRARRLAQATMRSIRQNLFFALAYNAVGVPVAAGVLYPFRSCCLAAAAMSLSSVSVIANALRLRWVDLNG